jgi:Ca2+-binding RTX toxin-like protein
VMASNNGGTNFDAQFKVKITDDDGKMTLDEIGNIGDNIDASLSGGAHADLDLLAGFGTQGIVTSFPTIEVHHFKMGWDFGLGTDTNSSMQDWGKGASVEFDDVTFNMGTFITDFLGPIFTKIHDIGHPIKPVLDVLTYPIPVLSQLMGSPVSLLTIAIDLGVAPPGIDTVASIVDKLIGISDEFAGLTTHAGAQDVGLEYPLGSFDLSKLSGGGGDLLTVSNSTDLIPGMKFDFSSAAQALEDAFDSGDPVAATAQLLDQMATTIGGSSFGGFVSDVTDFINSGLQYDKANNGLPKFTEFVMHFPLFEHPSQIFKLLLGQGANIDIFTFQLPTFGFDFNYHEFFPIWGPLGVAIDGDVGAHINIGGGYDLSGLLQYAKEGFRLDALHDIFYGFYIGTTRPVGTPPDADHPIFPLADFEAGLGAAAELNLGVASAGVEAKFQATIDLLAHDPDGDGRFHLNEMITDLEIGYNFIHGLTGNDFLSALGAPLGLFELQGKFELQFFAYIEALFGAWRKEFNLVPPITLLNFDVTIPEPAILADGHSTNSKDSDPNTIQDGLLRLNIGPYAKNRVNGNTTDGDEEVHLKHAGGTRGDETIAVWGAAFGVDEAHAQQFNQVKQIVIDAGAGNDRIVFEPSGGPILADASVMGGDGDDYLDMRGLDGHATIHGGSGNDTILGGDGAGEVIYGDAGADSITGGPGPDTIFGGTGDDTIDGGGGNDIILGGDGTVDTSHGAPMVSLAGGSGNDTLKGGDDNDLIYGDDGNDNIEGNAGQDTVYAGAGNDTVHGDDGNDLIYGEAGIDKLFGDAGDDVIIGGADSDAIIGGSGNDFLVGDDASVTIDSSGHETGFTPQGGNGNDVILGDDGDVDLSKGMIPNGPPVTLTAGSGGQDTVYGEDGADIIYGQEGNDSLLGDRDDDTVFGNAGDDFIDGGTGNDVLFGDDGQVTYVNTQVAGIPQIALYNQQINTTDPGVKGNDLIHGGAGDDIIFGGPNANQGQDTITGDEGKDLVFGDMGEVDFDWTLDKGSLFKTVKTTDFATGGADSISGGADSDIIFGGAAGDTISGDHDLSNGVVTHPGNDIIIGDQGEVDFDTSVKLNQIKEIYTTDQANSDGGVDSISGNEGNDIILGGVAGDIIQGDGNDILVGDEGLLRYDVAPGEIISGLAVPASVGDNNLSTLDLVMSVPKVGGSILGDADIIGGGPGTDLVIGGVAGDTLYGDGATLSPTTVTVTQLGFKEGQAATGALTAFNVPAAGKINTSFDLTVGATTYAVALISDNATLKGLQDDLTAALNLAGATGVTVSDDGSNHLKLTAADNTKQLTITTEVDQADILLGDNGAIFLAGGYTGTLVFQGSAVAKIITTDTEEDTGGPDSISGNAGGDIILGGVNNGGQDTLYGDRALPDASSIAADGDDVILGDNGVLDLNSADTNTYNPKTLILIRSFQDGLGGTDVISGNKGADVAIGGTGNDTIYGDDENASAGANDGADILLGDNADIFLVAPDNAVGGDLKLVLGMAVQTIRTTDDSHPPNVVTGGSDTISGNAGGDIIAGGVFGDTLYGDRALPTEATTANDGNDIILGDNGALEWLSTGDLSKISGIDIEANNPALYAKYSAGTADTDLTTLDLITTEQYASGGRDTIYGDNGSDVLFGGTDADTMYGDDGKGTVGAQGNNDLMLGDHGRLYPQFAQFQLADGTFGPALFPDRNFFAIDTGANQGGEGDQMWGEGGNDTMLGEQGDDRMFGGSGDDDMTGGSNVSGAAEERGAAGTVNATIGAAAVNDLMDGGSGNDAMAGDNAIIWRRGDDLSPRFRALTTATISIYTATNSTITTNVGATAQSDPDDAVGRDIQLLDHSTTTPAGLFGNDVMAGGGDNDIMFGELGNDLMQGDGSLGATADSGPNTQTIVTTDSGSPDTSGTLYFNIPEATTDGNDYMEGNGGNDLMYGGLGQDDMIGGSSDLFGLTDPNPLIARSLRPDGSDTIFGGAGIRIHRNDVGDPPSLGHGRDADYIMGDNADVFRLVLGGASGTDPNDPNDVFLKFAYDNYGGLQIVPRAMKELDYTLGGMDFNPTSAANDIGAADEIRGEDGDDTIFGMTGSDVLFGNAQDDDIVGGYGNDWISGGTGNDGVLGDDGLISTSRNGTAEPLYGIAATTQQTISTPGNMQLAVINPTGDLKKTFELVPFSFDTTFNGTSDEFPNNSTNTPFADDIIFGGLGDDSVHGGSGDDAISGAEALDRADVPVYDASGNPIGVQHLGYSDVSLTNLNPGNVLHFNPIDPSLKPQQPGLAGRTGQFALYDEFDPFRKILLTSTGTLSKDGTGSEFLLNFNATEGPLDTRWDKTNNKPTDGDDKIFGDNGNDWIVGGTGRDDMYGGWGNDLINADDDQTTNGGLNNVPDGPQPSYEDRAFGGAGKDVLIANTGGDRLIDWVGEFNSYLVPFSTFGMATVSRTRQPFIDQFLYNLSAADGADPNQAVDFGTDSTRNGEPAGEMGLVNQHDIAYHAQTGPPSDPQAGNTPGTHRDVIRSASYGPGSATGMVVTSGSWAIASSAYQNTTTSGDSVSLFYFDDWLPSYYEVTSTLKMLPGGSQNNAFLIFAYNGPTDFKYAGFDASANLLRIGQRTAAGWIDKATFSTNLSVNSWYDATLTVNGTTATLSFGNKSVQYTFTDPLNVGLIAVGTSNAVGLYKSLTVQKVPRVFTYQITDTFSATPDPNFTPQAGTWVVSGGRFNATPPAGGPAISTRPLKVDPQTYVEYQATVNAKTTGASAGLLFAGTDVNNFLYAAVVAGTNQVVLGHRSRGAWFTDAVASKTITAGTDYTLLVVLTNSDPGSSQPTVTVVLNGTTVLSLAYNFQTAGYLIGLLAQNGPASFGNVSIRGDDQTYAGGGSPQLVAAPAPAGAAPAAALTTSQLVTAYEAAVQRWTLVTSAPAAAAALADISLAISPLPGLMIGETIGHTVLIDPTAAGYGWYVDATPLTDSEFANPLTPGVLVAGPSSPAAGHMDLLTVVMHELGHLLGLDDINTEVNPADLMDATLPAGVRRLPNGPSPTPASPVSAAGVFAVAAPLPAGMSGDGQAVVLPPAGANLEAALPLPRPVAFILTPAGGTNPRPDDGRSLSASPVAGASVALSGDGQVVALPPGRADFEAALPLPRPVAFILTPAGGTNPRPDDGRSPSALAGDAAFAALSKEAARAPQAALPGDTSSWTALDEEMVTEIVQFRAESDALLG